MCYEKIKSNGCKFKNTQVRIITKQYHHGLALNKLLANFYLFLLRIVCINCQRVNKYERFKSRNILPKEIYSFKYKIFCTEFCILFSQY